ncbi:MAG TPA: hypothetical protein VGK78_12070 [Nocardioides sp.]|uniref:hypothetical protein n=1 Tax=Nocardioides sp. TaxID=35761 RepID=UPI002F40839B
MTGRSSTRRRVAALAVLVSAFPVLVACTLKSAGNSPQGPEPTQGPFASPGTETIPAIP